MGCVLEQAARWEHTSHQTLGRHNRNRHKPSDWIRLPIHWAHQGRRGHIVPDSSSGWLGSLYHHAHTHWQAHNHLVLGHQRSSRHQGHGCRLSNTARRWCNLMDLQTGHDERNRHCCYDTMNQRYLLVQPRSMHMQSDQRSTILWNLNSTHHIDFGSSSEWLDSHLCHLTLGSRVVLVTSEAPGL